MRRIRPYGDTISQALSTVLVLVREGHTISLAWERAGFSDRSWRAHAEKHPEDRDAMDAAAADRDARAEECLYRGACENPELALRYLERRRRSEWSKPAESSVNVAVGKAVIILPENGRIKALGDGD